MTAVDEDHVYWIKGQVQDGQNRQPQIENRVEIITY